MMIRTLTCPKYLNCFFHSLSMTPSTCSLVIETTITQSLRSVLSLFFGIFFFQEASHRTVFCQVVDQTKRYVRKCECPSYMYSGSMYPPHLYGPGYIMSRQTTVCLLTAAHLIPYFFIEDVYFTGFAAVLCGIEPMDHVGFKVVKEPFNPEEDLVGHPTNSVTMKTLFGTVNVEELYSRIVV